MESKVGELRALIKTGEDVFELFRLLGSEQSLLDELKVRAICDDKIHVHRTKAEGPLGENIIYAKSSMWVRLHTYHKEQLRPEAKAIVDEVVDGETIDFLEKQYKKHQPHHEQEPLTFKKWQGRAEYDDFIFCEEHSNEIVFTKGEPKVWFPRNKNEPASGYYAFVELDVHLYFRRNVMEETLSEQ